MIKNHVSSSFSLTMNKIDDFIRKLPIRRSFHIIAKFQFRLEDNFSMLLAVAESIGFLACHEVRKFYARGLLSVFFEITLFRSRVRIKSYGCSLRRYSCVLSI